MKQRFAELVGEAPDDDGVTGAETTDVGSAEAERRLDSVPSLADALEWLDQHAGWAPGTSRRKVSARLGTLDVGALQARAAARGRVSQRDIHGALADYYGAMPAGVGTYAGSYGPDGHAATTIVTREDWLDLACPLHTPRDRLKYENEQDVPVQLDGTCADAAVQRLAEIVELGTRFVNSPLYRLRHIDADGADLAGALGARGRARSSRARSE